MTASGTCMPGTFLRIHSAVFAERSGPTPARMKTLSIRPSASTCCMKSAQQRQVIAVLGLNELRTGRDFLGQPLRPPCVRQAGGIFRRTQEHARRETDLAAALKVMVIAQGARDAEQRHAVQIEHRLGLRMIAGLHAVAGQAQDVADAHGGAAENVALNRDAVLVAAGDLHDGRIADARQQRAHGETRHVAVRAAAVGGVDRIDIAVENPRAFVHFLRVGGIRRRKFGGDREAAGAQHAFEASRRGMPGQDRQRIARDRFVFEFHAAPLRVPLFSPAFSRATRSQEERP